MLPDNGMICEKEMPSFQDAGNGHQIFCHIPLEQLRQLEPVIHVPA
jgi:peptide/nickel transport system ATP-binding protein